LKSPPQAEQDADTILEWPLSQHAGKTGLRWFLRLREAIDSLAEMPKRCPLAPENASVPFEMRQLLYGRKPHFSVSCFTLNTKWCMCSASATVAVTILTSHIEAG